MPHFIMTALGSYGDVYPMVGLGTVLAARACGVDRRDALRLGAMMNTRGLMELIVLALGYELGLIDARLYAMLVLVAIATTLMTGPLLAWIDRRDARAQSAIGR